MDVVRDEACRPRREGKVSMSTDAIYFFGCVFSDDVEGTTEYRDEETVTVVRPDTGEKREIGISYHCSDGYPMLYLYDPTIHVVARRGYPERMSLPNEGPYPHERKWPFRAACEELGLPWDEARLGYWLVSWWG